MKPAERRPSVRRRPQAAAPFAAALLAAFVASAQAASSEVERTWRQAKLTWRQDGHIETGDLAAAARAFAGRKAPAVVYLHGCSGLDAASSTTVAFLADAGYLVAAPDSFARSNKPVSCKPETESSSLHRGVLSWRQAEAVYAVERLRQAPFVDGARIYLYGFSEGGIAAAMLTDVPVRARVIEGWGCHSGWPEYSGLRAPPGQPVLTLTSSADPGPHRAADCSAFMAGRFGSRALLFRPPDPLSRQHFLSGRADVQAKILHFLRSR